MKDVDIEVRYHGKTVGFLAKGANHRFVFAYADTWLENGFSVSPFSLPLKPGVFVPQGMNFGGLWGVFADSLPDAWGRLLADRMLLRHGLDPASLSQTDRLAIVGESGSGKSVSTLAVTKLLGPNAEVSGRIFFDGKEISDFSQEDMRLIRGRKIGRIFQEPGRSFDPLQNIGSIFLETFRTSFSKIKRISLIL